MSRWLAVALVVCGIGGHVAAASLQHTPDWRSMLELNQDVIAMLTALALLTLVATAPSGRPRLRGIPAVWRTTGLCTSWER